MPARRGRFRAHPGRRSPVGRGDRLNHAGLTGPIEPVQIGLAQPRARRDRTGRRPQSLRGWPDRRRYPRRHPLNRGRGNELNHLKYWHLEHQTSFPRCQPVSRAGNGACFQFRDCTLEAGDVRNDQIARLQEKIMITVLRPRFRSRDAAVAAAQKLSDLDPAHDCEAWPYRGYWVLVMRYRDDDGHILFKFAAPEDRLSKKHNIQA